MPNWCYNQVEIKFNTPEDVDKFIEKTGNNPSDANLNKFTFDPFVQPPKNPDDWRDHNINTLGTKWMPEEASIMQSDKSPLAVSFNYDSAWGPANKGIEAISSWLLDQNIPHVITESYDEPGMGFQGLNKYIDGEQMDNYYGETLATLYDYHIDEPGEMKEVLVTLGIETTKENIDFITDQIKAHDQISFVDEDFPSFLKDNQIAFTVSELNSPRQDAKNDFIEQPTLKN